MSGNLEVSFNSPQCGWMSIGFEDGKNEFHTTTASAPYADALPELLKTLVALLDDEKGNFARTLKWNRDPEEFDFVFKRDGDKTSIEIIEYPTKKREQRKSERVFSHTGSAEQIAGAFHETFEQLYEERDTDEFEQNWHQAFPFAEFEELKSKLN